MDDNNHIELQGSIELATTTTSCWKCGKATPVHSLIASNVLEIGNGQVSYETERPTFVSEIGADQLPAAVRDTVSDMAPNFRPTHSRTTGETTWSSMCVHCGMLQGAFFVHSEPDGPFFGEPGDFAGQRVTIAEVGFFVSDASFPM